MKATGLDFTKEPRLFEHLQNGGIELLVAAGKRLSKRIKEPFSLIVTCDRAEVICEGFVPHEAIEQALHLSPIAVSRYRYREEDALLHLFLLASGVLSPLFGEDTIGGQICDAAEASRLIGSSSPEIEKLMNMAVAFSKRIHTDLDMRVFDKTIADEIERRLKGFTRILVIGSGEAARALAGRLCRVHEVFITLRDAEKTFLVPPGCKAVPYEKRLEKALSSDAIISASSGLYNTLTSDECRALYPRPLYDLSSPHDLPDDSGAIRIEDLGIELPERDRIIALVYGEAEKERDAYKAWLERAESADDVFQRAESIAYEALRRLEGPISKLSLDADSEKELRIAIFDSVRKASVSKTFGKRK